MATLLETLKRVSFFKGTHCPYELFASLYHVALPFQSDILDETFYAKKNPIGAYIADIAWDAGDDSFDIDAALLGLEGMIQTEAQAALTTAELLNRLDLYLSGADSHQEQGNRASFPFFGPCPESLLLQANLNMCQRREGYLHDHSEEGTPFCPMDREASPP